jgi:ATP-binding cassette subfamily B protein
MHEWIFDAIRAEHDVRAAHLERVLTQPEFAKDLRTYDMSAPLLGRWRRRYGAYLDTAKRVRIRSAMKLTLASLFAGICLGLPLYAIGTGYYDGRFGIADLAIFLGALVQLRDGLAAIVYNIGDLIAFATTFGPTGNCLPRTLPIKPCTASG